MQSTSVFLFDLEEKWLIRTKRIPLCNLKGQKKLILSVCFITCLRHRKDDVFEMYDK